LLIHDEGIAGIAATWTFAITEATGEPHGLAALKSDDTLKPSHSPSDWRPRRCAVRLAQQLGFSIGPTLRPLIAA